MQHILSRRHRKFALDADNWADLDEFLDNIPRPILSYYRNKAKAEVCEETSEEGSGSERSYDEADEDMEPVYDQQSDDEDRERQEYLAGINGYDDTNSDGEQAEREPSDIDEDEQQNHGEEDIDMEGTIRDQPQSPCSTKSKSSASEGEYYAAVTQSPSVSPV